MFPTGRTITRSIGLGLIGLWLALPAHAQVCREEGVESPDNVTAIDCDMRYAQTKLTCTDTYEMRGREGNLTLPTMFPTCPREEMPTRSTPKLSFIKSFTPYLFDFLRDPEDNTRPYAGYIARGTTGDPNQTFAVIGNAPQGVTRQKGCVNQINLEGVDSPEERAKLVRLQLDNCANQFILNSAIYPYHKAGSNQICGTEANPARRCTQEDMCQPLRMRTDSRQEYQADTYIKAAWKKLLQDPGYRKTQGAPKEPHLPDGIDLANPIAPPAAADQEIRLSAITATEYEEIIDPSHPFSPRWDFKYNEREFYSPTTSTYMSKYHDDAKAVYCAGNRADSGDESKDKDYKVDVLEFRREVFNKGITNRIGYNTACYNDKGDQRVPIMTMPVVGIFHPQFISMVAGAYCYKVIAPPIPAVLPYYQGYEGQAQRVPCWECFKLNGKVDDSSDSQKPPCTTRYDSEDLSIKPPYLPGGRNGMKTKAICMMNPAETNKPMSTLCRDLRAPYAPLNKLKMRYHNPEGKEDEGGGEKTVVLKGGVQEGLWHKEYFGNHMPYPRLWDTGSSLQKSTGTDQDPLDALGQFTAIVGVGREATPGDSQSGGGGGGDDDDATRTDQRCLYGGWGDNVSVGGASITIPDPVTSWTELKLYQAYTTRETNTVCIGRYEKAFKYRSSENQLLVAAGAERTGILRTTCDVDDRGRTITSSCVSREVGEEEADGQQQGQSEGQWHNMQYIRDSLPLAWRGYIGDADSNKEFPKLADGASLITGLDNAQCGDIILMPYGGGTESDTATRGLPKLARVVCEAGVKGDAALGAVRNMKGKHYIEVEEADNGKWPDVCGTTDMMGELKSRRLFKPGEMRPEITATLDRLEWTTSCTDTKLSECEMEQWGELKLYRPVDNVVEGSEEDSE